MNQLEPIAIVDGVVMPMRELARQNDEERVLSLLPGYYDTSRELIWDLEEPTSPRAA